MGGGEGRIVGDVARGVERSCTAGRAGGGGEGGGRGRPPVAHRDLKTSNVLLKDDMHACIGDLGLALALGRGVGGRLMPK